MNLLEQLVFKVIKEELPNGTPEEAAAICEARIMQAFILIPKSAIKALEYYSQFRGDTQPKYSIDDEF